MESILDAFIPILECTPLGDAELASVVVENVMVLMHHGPASQACAERLLRVYLGVNPSEFKMFLKRSFVESHGKGDVTEGRWNTSLAFLSALVENIAQSPTFWFEKQSIGVSVIYLLIVTHMTSRHEKARGLALRLGNSLVLGELPVCQKIYGSPHFPAWSYAGQHAYVEAARLFSLASRDSSPELSAAIIEDSVEFASWVGVETRERLIRVITPGLLISPIVWKSCLRKPCTSCCWLSII